MAMSIVSLSRVRLIKGTNIRWKIALIRLLRNHHLGTKFGCEVTSSSCIYIMMSTDEQEDRARTLEIRVPIS